MKNPKRKIVGLITSSAAAAMIMIIVITFRSSAQSGNTAPKAQSTNGMAPYYEAVQEAIDSDTEATNLTGAERNHLMNDSIKTNLAAQLWFRTAMIGGMSQQGAKMAEEIRVLESLREGHTDDAIRRLENDLDGDIVLLTQNLRAGDQTKAFQPTRQPVEALKMAKEYRLKFPYKSGNSAMDEQVKFGLSYPEEKIPVR